MCSRNRWRSPTAERIFRDSPRFDVRSRGTASSARRKLTEADLRWADALLVMEQAHARRIRERFGQVLGGCPAHVLGIPDRFAFMDPELVERIREGVEAFLEAAPFADDPNRDTLGGREERGGMES